jgi:hypothetical protein
MSLSLETKGVYRKRCSMSYHGKTQHGDHWRYFVQLRPLKGAHIHPFQIGKDLFEWFLTHGADQLPDR